VSLRSTELVPLAAELSRELAGAVVQKVSAPTATRAYVEVRVPGRSFTLLLCAEAGVARLSAVEARPANPPRPPGWQAVLRRELVGAKLRDAEALPTRRTLLVHLERAGEARALLTLVLELGAEPLLALVNEQARVLAVSTPSREGVRVGAAWKPLEERPAGDAPSRLQGDHVHLRLAHAAEALFTTVEQKRWSDARRAPVLAKLKRLERTREKVKGDLSRTERAQELRREGELLAQNLFRLTRGATHVTVPEYLEDGTTRDVTIALDPQRTPKDEVDRRFHQYRRLTRGAELARQRLATLDAEAAALREELARLDEAPPEAPPPGAPGRPRSTQAPLPPFREYVGAGGQRIWVGRGAAHNDALTFHVARPFHLWLHARGVPGAHVVVPLEKNAQVSSEALIDAAHLAVHHSDAKGEPRAEVSYTLVKFVRKAKGAGPGTVTFTREKTILVRLERDRLARLLAQDETR